MMDKNRHTPGRIPVRFVDEDERSRQENPGAADGGADAGELSPEEIGRASIYEDETETQRRIDRGGEGQAGGADDADVAGGPPPSELPERREDQDTNASHRDGGTEDPGVGEGPGDEPQRMTAGSGGPAVAELVATRAELRRVETELQKLAGERHDLLDKLTRRQADFENYRKRVERERAATYDHAVGDVVKRLLPVLDNLRRALAAEGSFESGESEEFRHFLRGVELIEKQLNGVLENLGVAAVPTVGERFDPHIHEAVATEETDEFEPDTVTEELQRGYRLGDKLLRPAMVKVAT